MAVRNYSNTAPPVSLTIGVSPSATQLTVASTAGYPTAPFLLGVERGTANEEVVLCTGLTATTFTVQRGYDNTTAKDHGITASVEHTVAAIDYREANAHVNTPHNIGNMLPTPGLPVDSNPGDVSATGTAVEPARADHKHRREGYGNPIASTPNDVMAQGTSNTLARSDHKHARESYATIRDNVLPPGMIIPFAGPSNLVPPGWLLCVGQQISRTDYANLWNMIGTNYGNGNGTTTFTLPDLRGRVIAGLNAMGGSANSNRIQTAHFGESGNILGTGFGSDVVTLSQGQMPIHTHGNDAHNHSQNSHNHDQTQHNHSQNPHDHGVHDPQHTHGVGGSTANWIVISPGGQQQHWITGLAQAAGGAGNAQVTFSNVTHGPTNIGIFANTASNNPAFANIIAATATNNAATVNIHNAGSGQAHSNVQPTMVMNYLIKT